MLFKAHQGFGYLVFLGAAVVMFWSLVEALRDNEPTTWSSRVRTGFIGLVDLQVLIGIVLYVLYAPGARPSWVHPLTMIITAGMYHVGNRTDRWSRFALFTGGFVLLMLGWNAVL